MKINNNYLNLKDSYLFSTIARKVSEYSKENPNTRILRLGIGDVTLPLGKTVIEAMQKATEEMGSKGTFKGYGEEQGYLFLRESICNYYKDKNVSLSENEVFISDGAKSDLGNILDIFDNDNTVLIQDPVYPVYVDTNIMAGRKITYMNGSKENNFLPLPDSKIKADIIYLCSPNNPTGAVYNKEQLKKWVDFALKNKAVILFDSAYEAFIQNEKLPTSIYQIEGAKECAIEFCSFSKTAGFTGVRCGYTVVPQELSFDGIGLNKLWLRRQTTKFNGVSYITQRGANAVFSEEGKKEIKKNISYYLGNAQIMKKGLEEAQVWHIGGENSPYIWLECPKGMTSWEYFDFLLKEASVVGTPGAGFGKNGEGFLRLTAFGERENIEEAIRRVIKTAI